MSPPSRLVILGASLLLSAVVIFSMAPQAGAARPGAKRGVITARLEAGVHPNRLAVGLDGTVWYSGIYTYPHEGGEMGTGERGFIGDLSPGGNPTLIALADGTRAGQPVTGPGGDIWFPESHTLPGESTTFEFVEFSSSGTTQSYPVSAGVTAIEAATQMEGDLWFSGAAVVEGAERGVIGRVAPGAGGLVTLFPLEPGCGAGEAIAATTDRIWFGESCPAPPSAGLPVRAPERSDIGEMDSAGAVTRFPLPTGDRPIAVAAASDQSVWVGMENDHYRRPARLVHVDASGSLAALKVKGAKFSGMAVGAEGRLWFASIIQPAHYDGLASIGPGGRRSRPICVDRGDYCDLGIDDLATGPEGTLWWTAGLAPSFDIGGGGGSGLLEGEDLERAHGYIGKVH